MKSLTTLGLFSLALHLAAAVTLAQTTDSARFRELREKARGGTITLEERQSWTR